MRLPLELTAEVKRIAAALRTQDNRCTHLPIYVVQVKHREYGYDPDYTEDTVVWLHCDGIEADAEETAELDEKYEAGEDTPDEWTRTSYQDRWDFVQPFFTERAAKEYIDQMQHRHRGMLRIYVESGYRNAEWEFLRNLLMALSPAGVELELTKAQREALSRLCWGLTHFDGFCTGRSVRRSTMLTLVQLGLASDVGLLLLRDDGYPDRERFRRGFRPTLAGLELAKTLNEIDEQGHQRLASKLAELSDG